MIRTVFRIPEPKYLHRFRDIPRFNFLFADKLKIYLQSSQTIFVSITKVQENQVGLKLNGKYQLLAYADDVNLPGDKIAD
jgi:hypothetical protein